MMSQRPPLPETECSPEGMFGSCNICNSFRGVSFTSPQLKQQHMNGKQHAKQKRCWEQLRLQAQISRNHPVNTISGSTPSVDAIGDVTSAFSNMELSRPLINNGPSPATQTGAVLDLVSSGATGNQRPARPYNPIPAFPASSIADQELLVCLDSFGDQYRCNLCEGGINISGKENLDQHLRGRKHQRNLQFQQNFGQKGNAIEVPLSQPSGIVNPPAQITSTVPAFTNVPPPLVTTAISRMEENLTVTPNPVAVLNAPIGIDYEELDRLTCQYRCIPCNTVISGDINLEQHRQGRAHIKRLAGLSSSTSGTSRYYYTEEPTTTEKSPDNDDGVGAAMSDEPANDSGKSKNSAMGLEDFESKCVLGQGAGGVVFKVYRDFDKQEYALKRVKRRCQGSLEEEKVKREVHALASLQHDHIVRYYTAWFGETGEEEINEPSTSSSSSSSTGSWLTDSASSFDKPQPGSYLFIQMELCLKYTLDDCIYDKDRAKNKKLLPLLDYYDQIVESIVYVHGHPKGFIHRDLKPSNVFFCEDNSKDQGLCHWTVKVGDFGLVTESSSEGDDLKSNISANIQRTASRGTPLYKSPEQHGCTYGNKVDVYALGIILVEILCKFSTKSERIMELTKLRRAPPCRQALAHLLPHDHFRYCDLLTSLLSHDPDGRPSAAQLLVELRKIYDPNLPSEDHQLASCPPILDPRNHQDTNRRYQRK